MRSDSPLEAGFVVGIQATGDRLSALCDLFAHLPTDMPAAIWLAIAWDAASEASGVAQLAAATALPLEPTTIPTTLQPGRVGYLPASAAATVATGDSIWQQLQRHVPQRDRLIALAFSPISPTDQPLLQTIRQTGGLVLVVPPTAAMGAIAQTLITYMQCAVPLPPPAPTAPSASPTCSSAPQAIATLPNEVELLYEQVPIGLALVDRDLRYIRANDMLGRIHGHESAAAYVGQRVDAVAPHLAAKILPFYQQVLATQEPLLNVEVCCPHPINPAVESTYLVSYHPVWRADGQLCGISVSAVDVTELRRAEDLLAQHNRTLAAQVDERTAALQQSEDSFRMALRSARMVGWQRHLETGELWHFGTFRSGGVWEATDWHLADDEFTVHPADAAWVQQAVATAIAHRSELAIEYRLLFPDHSIAWVLSRGQVMRAAGKATHLFGVMLDITPRKQAELALVESEQRFQSLAANLPGIIFRYLRQPDHAEAFTYLSPNSEEIWELEAEAIQANPNLVWQQIDPDDLAAMQTSIDQSAETLQPWQLEWRITTPSGRQKWLQGIARPHRRSDGAIAWDGLVIDVSDRKAAEVALRRSEATSQAIVRGIPDLLLRMDGQNGRYLEVFKREGVRLLNPDTVQAGASVFDNMPRPLAQERLDYIQRALATNTLQVYEYALSFADETRYEEARIVPLADNTALLFVRDVSDRKQATAALKLSEQCFRAIFDNAAIGVVIEASPDFKLGLANAYYLRMLGYTSEELRQLTHRDITVAADLAQQDVCIAECVAGRRSGYQIEKRYIRKDGSQIWVNMTTSIVRNDHGDIAYYISVVEDITERKCTIDLEINCHQAVKTAIFEESNDAILLVNPDTQHIVDCNRRAIALFAAQRQADLLHRTPNSLRQQPLSESAWAAHWQHILTATVWQGEVEYHTLRGQPFWGLLSVKWIRVAEQSIILMQITDSGDRKPLELDRRPQPQSAPTAPSESR